MRKICVVVLSRANYGRVKSVMQAVKEHPELKLSVVAGASALVRRFGTVSEIIKNDGFQIDASIYSLIEGETPETMAKSTGLGLLELPTIFNVVKPSIVITVADRFETLSTAVAATYMNLPLAHIQGGEISGSIDESIRHAVTKLAHIHFPATKLAAERIIRMGERPETVFHVGDPAMDIVASVPLGLDADNIFKYGGVGPRIDLSEEYLLVMQHPVTTEYSDALKQINETLNAVRELEMPTIMFWPNPDAGSEGVSKGIRVFREKFNPNFIHFFINLPVKEYIQLLYNCACAVGNSSSFIREGSFLGVPAVNIGTRQQGRERGKNVIDVGYNRDEIKRAILKQINHGKYKPEHIYGDGKAGKRIAEILATCEINIQKELTY